MRWAGRTAFPESRTTGRWLRRLPGVTIVKPSSSTTGGAGTGTKEEAAAEVEDTGWGGAQHARRHPFPHGEGAEGVEQE